jgi:hypothetical protein
MSWWQRGVAGLVTDRNVPLPILVNQPMGNVADAALAAVPTVTIARKGASPELQDTQADGHGSANRDAMAAAARRDRGSPAPTADQPGC